MIDIEEVKFKACNYLCVHGRLATKETRMIYKLGQALEQLQAENKKLREGQEWVSVENELPDDDGGFLTVVEGDDDTYINYFVELGDQTGEWQTNQIVTHWKPLPSPPQDKELKR